MRLPLCLAFLVHWSATCTCICIWTLTCTHAFTQTEAFIPSASSFRPSRIRSPLHSTSSPVTAAEKEQTIASTAGAATQNAFGTLSDTLTGAIFGVLHAHDETGIQDASKNLRVLWARALLHSTGRIEDAVAATLLPPNTRDLVASPDSAKLFRPVLKFLEWIQARTEFIDGALDSFLSSPACLDQDGLPKECQVVLFGAGYDTRALRYRHKHRANGDNKLQFIEVDLPDVVEGKQRLYQKFARENDPTWDLENDGTNFVPFDLNECGAVRDNTPKSLLNELETKGGFRNDIPTLFVFEAVLFYVEEDAIRNIFDDLSSFMRSWKERDNAEALLCMTDSLKPFVDVPFTSETDSYFASVGLDLLEHRARWGGAVHFALAANSADEVDTTTIETAPKRKEGEAASSRQQRKNRKHSPLGQHVASTVDSLVYSYLPTRSNNPEILDHPTFDDTWYAVAYPWQIDGYANSVEAQTASRRGKKPTNKDPFATRFWGEPVVIYRDADGEAICVTDVCPHRSAPLSMGTVENGELTCFYHGWTFGSEGKCVDVPTLRAVPDERYDAERDSKFRKRVNKSFCSKAKACVEHEGLIWLWRGNVLTADPSKLPSRRKGDMETITIDSVLDYNVDYSYIVENNLDSVHLFYLHDGSVPPLVSIGMMNKNLDRLRLSSFKDDCGIGHLGKLGDGGRPKKLIRFDPPNIVRHGGVSGFEEEFHIIPVAPHRTRVLLRQHIPKGPILSTVTGLPGMPSFLTALVNNWNYHIGLEDASVMKGQSHLIEEFGAPRMQLGGLGDDLVAKYWRWRDQAYNNMNADAPEGEFRSPYFQSFDYSGSPVGISSGTSVFGDSANAAKTSRATAQLSRTTYSEEGSTGGNADFLNRDSESAATSSTTVWGIKRTYSQNNPSPDYPPMNYKRYKAALRWDDLTKQIFTGQEPSCSMIKTTNEMERSQKQASSKANNDMAPKGRPQSVGIAAASAVAALLLAASQGVVPAIAGVTNSLFSM